MIKMIPVSTAICAAGGYTAQFADQEEAKDARDFIPAVLKNAGIRLDEAIFAKFCQRVFEKMVEHTASTGDWTTWTKVMTTRLYVLGRFEAKDAKVPQENVELVVVPLEGFRLNLAGWSLQNVIVGNEMKLTTVSDQGGETMDVVTGTKDVEIHGTNCPIDPAKDDEGVWLRAANKAGDKIDGLRLEVISSDVKTVVVRNPGAALLAPYAEAEFEVRSRAGNEGGELQSKVIKATVKAVAPVEPVWKYSDELYVQTMTPRTGTAFKVGEPIDLTGRGLTDNATAPLYLGNVKANFNGGETSCSVNATYADDGTSGSWTIEDNEDLEPGSHEGELEIWVIEGGSPNVKTLPLTVVKEA